MNRRRRILENELLSIHSCAIVWQAVIVAHFEAIEKTNNKLKNYTAELSKIATHIATEELFTIHEYCNERIVPIESFNKNG